MTLVTFHLVENKNIDTDIELINKWKKETLTKEEVLSLIRRFISGDFNYELPWLKHEKTITHSRGWSSYYSYKGKTFSKISTLKKYLDSINTI